VASIGGEGGAPRSGHGGFRPPRESSGSLRAGSSDQLGHALRGRATGLALTLELPDRGLPVETIRLLEHLQAALSELQDQLHAFPEREAVDLFLKLVAQIVSHGSHDLSI